MKMLYFFGWLELTNLNSLCFLKSWQRWQYLATGRLYQFETISRGNYIPVEYIFWRYLYMFSTGTCFIQNIYAPSSSLLQGKHLPFSPSPLRLNIFRLFVILSLTQLYRYTPQIFLFSTATFKYTYRAPLRRIGQE
jgi:hypothetical protein